MSAETWLPAPRLGGKYEVSSDGRVRNARTGRILVAPPDRDGYRSFTPLVAGRQSGARVHRLVCEAFNGPPPFERAVVRHLNGNVSDNRPANLAWGSYADNEADKRLHGRVAKGEGHGRSKLTDDAVRDIRGRYGRDPSALIAEEYGVHRSLVWQIGTGHGWEHVA